MKKLLTIALMLSLLLVSCQTGNIDTTLSGETSNPIVTAPSEQSERKSYNYYKETDDFGFKLDCIEGKIERGNRILAKVWLENLMDENVSWSGSSSAFQPYMKLICADTEYVIYQNSASFDADISYNEVIPDEKRESGHIFTIPTDAIAGKYNMECVFNGSKVIFENIFTLD